MTILRAASISKRAAAKLTTVTSTTLSRTSTRTKIQPHLFFSSLSSFADPQASLFDHKTATTTASKTSTAPTNNSASNFDDVDALLRSDVKAMGSMLGQIIAQRESPELFAAVEHMRLLAKEWRGTNRTEDAILEKLTGYVAELSNAELQLLSRAFTHFLALANTAEAHHRTRKNTDYLNAKNSAQDNVNVNVNDNPMALMDKRDSCGGVIQDLLHNKGVSKSDIMEALCHQNVELVLTAHPTEVNRRTTLDKKKSVLKLLSQADALRSSGSGASYGYAAHTVQVELQKQISSLWQSDEVARTKPSPQEEARRGTLVLESVLWEALPSYLEKLSHTMQRELGGPEYALPLTACPVKFSSWMGGDRDGNPNVTPQVTREVLWTNRIKCCELISNDVEGLIAELTPADCSPELRAVVGGAREPYRHFFREVFVKLERTQQWNQAHFEGNSASTENSNNGSNVNNIYMTKQELLDDLLLAHASLCHTNNAVMANTGKLMNLIRNVSSFGLALCPLDVRQESTRHTEALDAITRFIGVGRYSEWDEDTRLTWLSGELMNKRPLIRHGAWRDNSMFSDTAVDTLETFAAIAECPEESLGAYVISQATSASDVMAVLMLQRNAGVAKELRVVPLFETLDDLKGAKKSMETLYTTPAYVGSLRDRKQEIMIGYSDSAKDAGRLAASWAQYESQEELAALAKQYHIDLTFFHGKGGTVGRGGNPSTFDAILSHAPETINGRFRVTEQGEMINQNFGHAERAERTLDIYTAAVLAEKQTKRPVPSAEWRELMHKLSEKSCAAYRKIVRGDERFVPYFRSATPELELSELKIGSRPAKRKASGGVESLRAIPWNFAWTQTRLNLPTWLGVGQAVNEMLDSEDAEAFRNMYNEWGSFRTTIDLVEMVLAKSEPVIAKHYDDLLVTDDLAKELGLEIRQIHHDTEQAVLRLANHTELGEDNALLCRVLKVRNPYVDCLNVLQAETLKRLRAVPEGEGDSERKKVLNDALLTTITGIANGMGNTG